MFTGIVEEIGTLSHLERMGKIPHTPGKNGPGFCKLTVRASRILDDCKQGDSVAVNGVCLTVTHLHSDGFVADAMAETMRRSNLEALRVGDKVNLERSLRLCDRLGGHIVAGHVDEVGTITGLRREDIATVMSVRVSPSITKYIAVKGSVCVDGVSLTVTGVEDAGFQVWLIPFTRENTTLGLKRVGDAVNIEVDMLARYLERLIVGEQSSGTSVHGISKDFLKAYGFFDEE